ncbi:hypothetical protein [Methylobacterium nonmethylotrophicum]|uniref:hypothetical protein n=1 Tax=Methylobacterium nonmethylotrophicum TaxID=1141884 RepID=UPI003CCB0B08
MEGRPRGPDAQGAFTRSLCDALGRAVDAAGAGPVFVASYGPGPTEADLPDPLRRSAFTYDNALAAIALQACGDLPRARRIGDALLHALGHDRTFGDGRIRNAYRAGPVGEGTALLPGWWDARQNLWAEDGYQDGTATGNVAWAALALLNLDGSAPSAGYRAGARRMLGWITANATDARAPEGFSGGRDGFDPAQTVLAWKSTEHNLDVHAVAAWLHRLEGRPEDARTAATARRFLDAVFASGPGAFRLGTTPEGRLQPTDHVALDTQLWPLIGVAAAPATWRRSLAYAEAHLATAGGFDFNEDRDGLWVEGTAQAALAYRVLGRPEEADRLLSTIARQVSPSGLLFATDVPSLSTGIPIGPASQQADFFYFRRPHLGATAWGVLAATGWNPFTGNRVE